MITLDEIKLWLKIDFDDDDETLLALIKTSEAVIESATGVIPEFIMQNENSENNNIKKNISSLKELYLMIQRIIIKNLYDEKEIENKTVITFYLQLESTYKNLLKEMETQI